jgi:hypothetical protein
MKKNTRSRTAILCSFFAIPFSFFLAAGCSSTPASLTLRPAGKDTVFAKTFDRAYAGHMADGSDAFVLVSDEAPAVRAASKSAGPIKASSTSAPLRQLVFVKLLWRPMNGMRDSAAANASITWYVMNDAADGGDDLLVYQGAGYATVDPGEATTGVTIRSGDLKPSASRGSLKDPIGPAQISGSFVAVNNDARARELLQDARSRTAMVASGQ